MIDFSKFPDGKSVKVTLKTYDGEKPTVYFGLINGIGGVSPGGTTASGINTSSCIFLAFPDEKSAREQDYESDTKYISLDSSSVESVEVLE